MCPFEVVFEMTEELQIERRFSRILSYETKHTDSLKDWSDEDILTYVQIISDTVWKLLTYREPHGAMPYYQMPYETREACHLSARGSAAKRMLKVRKWRQEIGN